VLWTQATQKDVQAVALGFFLSPQAQSETSYWFAMPAAIILDQTLIRIPYGLDCTAYRKQ